MVGWICRKETDNNVDTLIYAESPSMPRPVTPNIQTATQTSICLFCSCCHFAIQDLPPHVVDKQGGELKILFVAFGAFRLSIIRRCHSRDHSGRSRVRRRFRLSHQA